MKGRIGRSWRSGNRSEGVSIELRYAQTLAQRQFLEFGDAKSGVKADFSRRHNERDTISIFDQLWRFTKIIATYAKKLHVVSEVSKDFLANLPVGRIAP